MYLHTVYTIIAVAARNRPTSGKESNKQGLSMESPAVLPKGKTQERIGTSMREQRKVWPIVLIVVGVIVVIALALVGYGVSTYNTLTTKEITVNEKNSVIQSQLQRRSDLIPNLVNTVKGYASHEEEIINDVTDARAKMMQAGNTADQLQADQQMSSALARLFAIAENYPDLKANQNFLSLQEEIAGTENRIAVARKDWIEAVNDYNKSVRRFPSSVIAGMFGFEQMENYQAPESATSNPVVSF